MMKHVYTAGRYSLAATRLALGLPLLIGAALTLLPLQNFVMRPLFKNNTTVPKFIFNTMRRFLGIKIEFNAKSAPLEKKRPVWYVANHMSMADFLVLGSALSCTFAGKGELLMVPGWKKVFTSGVGKMPKLMAAQIGGGLMRGILNSINYMGLRRSSEFNRQNQAKLIAATNEGRRPAFFPEGTTSPGKVVHRFNHGMLDPLFGATGLDKSGNEVKLAQDTVLQAVAVRVKSVNGVDAVGRDDLRDLYSMYEENNALTRIWKRLMIRNLTIELTAFTPLEAKDFANKSDMINKAALDVASIVNPGQTSFERAQIPAMP